MPFCQNCGKKLDEGTKFCPDCGTPAGKNAEDGSVRTQKYLGGGIQFKCPNCGAVTPRTATKCTECGYKIDFKKRSDTVKQLTTLIDAAETKWDIKEIVANFDFPLDMNEMLELAIFSSEKADNPYYPFDSWDNLDSESIKEARNWLSLIKRIEKKALLMSENPEITKTITNIRINSEESFNKRIEDIRNRQKEKDKEYKKKSLKLFVGFIFFIAFLLGFIWLIGGFNVD